MTGEQRALTEQDLATLTGADRDTLRAAIDGVPRKQLTAVLASDAGTAALRAAFARMPEFYTGERFDPPVVTRWCVRNQEPGTDLEYDVRLGDGRCAIEPADGSVRPAVTLTMDATSFIELASGARAGVDLLMRGRLRVGGNPALAMRMESLFGLGAGERT